MKITSFRTIVFIGLTLMALTAFANEIVLPEEMKASQIQSDIFLMQEPFSSEPLQFYSSLEANPYN